MDYTLYPPLSSKKNFKQQFDECLNLGNQIWVEQLRTPRIDIIEVDITTSSKYISVDLITRFNDRISFASYTGISANNAKEFKDFLFRQFIEEKGDIYNNIEITDSRTGTAGYEKPAMRTHNFNGIMEKNMKKYIDPNTGIIYLLYDGGGSKRFGYSIFDESLLDTYCMRNFVNNLPTISISQNQLFNYYLIAL